jgi:ABC-type dipeptide/oligopeptide/nickel transport system permease subunit
MASLTPGCVDRNFQRHFRKFSQKLVQAFSLARIWLSRHPVAAIGIFLLSIVISSSIFAPVLAPQAPEIQDLDHILALPSGQHLLGTDALGRDILSRLMWAGRISLAIATVVLCLSLLIGGSIGLVAGFYGGWIDELCMRGIDLFLSIPTLILALALIGTLGTGLQNMTLALTISWFPAYARLVRSQVLVLKNQDFITAAITLGGSSWHMLWHHYLPSLVGVVVVQLSLDVGAVVLAIAGLSFIGLGVQPPMPEWGTMLVDARPLMQVAPHTVMAPGLAIFATVFGFHALSEALENWLEPRN